MVHPVHAFLAFGGARGDTLSGSLDPVAAAAAHRHHFVGGVRPDPRFVLPARPPPELAKVRLPSPVVPAVFA